MRDKNAVVIICNDIDFFRLMAENFPDDVNDVKLIVCNDDRLGDRSGEITEILEKSILNEWELLKASEINELLNWYGVEGEFVEDYTMSTKMTAPWFVFETNEDVEKLLVLDEDVILNDGFSTLFDSDKSLFYTMRLSAGPKDYFREGSAQDALFKELFRVNDIEFSLKWWQESYIKCYIGAGNMLILRDDFDNDRYLKVLEKFFKSNLIKSFWDKRKVHTSYFIDERFMNLFLDDVKNNGLNKLVHVEISKPEKITNNSFNKMKRALVIHNATKSHKRKVYNMMIDNGVIKGEYL